MSDAALPTPPPEPAPDAALPTPPPTPAALPTTRRWLWFAAWFAVGGLFCLALLGALTIGIFVLPVAAVLTVVVATRRGSVSGLPGLISGAGLPLLYVAFLNREGPGTVCHAIGSGSSTGTECDQLWSPWPWLVAGLTLVAVGVGVMAWMTIDKRPRSA